MASSRYMTFAATALAALLFTDGRATAATTPAPQEDARAQNDEVREVRRRLRVMRTAVEVLIDADKRDAAHLVEHAMHARELALERRDDAEARKIRETAPKRGQLSELLGLAARLHAEAGREAEAHALADLAKVYRGQERRRGAQQPAVTDRRQEPSPRLQRLRRALQAFEGAGAKPEAEALRRAIHVLELEIGLERARQRAPRPEQLRELLGRARALAGPDRREARGADAIDLDRLGHRIEILRVAHAAFREAEKADAAEYLGRFIEVAELQRSGAEPEKLAKAAAGMKIGTTIELLQRASGMYREWDHAQKARLCNALAEYYARRDRQRAGAATDRAEPEPRRLDIRELRDRVEVWRLARRVFDQSGWESGEATARRMVHVGELVLEQVGLERLREAAADLPSLEERVALLRKAAELAKERDRPDQARALTALAKYYAERQR